MKSLRRLIFKCSFYIAILSCIAMAILWIRGRLTNDEIYLNLQSHLIILGSFPNHAHVIFYRNAEYHGAAFVALLNKKNVPHLPEFWQVRFDANSHKWELSVPWWLPMMFALAWPLLAASRMLSRRRLLQKGRCLNCGYDLRASKDRCPECGTLIQVKSA